MKKKKCPECGWIMSRSEWTEDWHCENMNCTVTEKADGRIHHRHKPLADMGKKGTGEKNAYGVGT